MSAALRSTSAVQYVPLTRTSADACSIATMEIKQGADFMGTIDLTDSDGYPADLTDVTAQIQLRRGPADSNPTVDAECLCEVLNPGVVKFALPNAVTKTLNGRYEWDLDLLFADGTIQSPIGGPAIVTPEITRQAG